MGKLRMSLHQPNSRALSFGGYFTHDNTLTFPLYICRQVLVWGRKRVRTNVFLARALVGDLGGHNAHKDANLVCALIDLIGRPVDALQSSLGDHV